MELYFEVFNPSDDSAPILAVRDTGSSVEFVGDTEYLGLADYLPEAPYASMPERLYFLFRNPMNVAYESYEDGDTSFDEIVARVSNSETRKMVEVPEVDLSKANPEEAVVPPKVKGTLPDLSGLMARDDTEEMDA